MTAATPELRWHAIGRRKVSVARVYLTPGSGKWNINGRNLGDYFPRPSLVSHIQQPFTATDTLGAFDVRARVAGGGVTGQAGAVRMGIARVYLTPGSGKWSINGLTLGDYFPRPSLVSHIQQPFTATDTLGAFDVKARVVGGGLTGQAGAMRLGIARALVLADDRHRKKLREQGLLTRDPRAVERKKPGRAGARKRFQFSKR